MWGNDASATPAAFHPAVLPLTAALPQHLPQEKKKSYLFSYFFKNYFETKDPRQTCQYHSLYIKDGCKQTHYTMLVTFHYGAQRYTYGCKVYKII